MHCEYCGKEIGEAKFCRYCGKKVLPPVSIAPWRQSMPFGILGFVLSTTLLLFFQTHGLVGWICLLLYAAISILWFNVLAGKVEQIEERRRWAREQREDYKPDSRFMSFANCFFGWALGFFANRAVERGALGKLPKVVSGVVIGGCVLTAAVGFSVGFLNVNLLGQFALRSTSTVRTFENNVGATVCATYDRGMSIYIFEPTWGSPYNREEPVEEIAGRDTSIVSYNEHFKGQFENQFEDCDEVLFIFTREGDDAYTDALYEIRLCFEYDASPAEYRERAEEFLTRFYTF